MAARVQTPSSRGARGAPKMSSRTVPGARVTASRTARAKAPSVARPAMSPAPAPRLPGRPHRNDGWTSDRRRAFIAALGEGHTVEAACGFVGLSPASAYALRRRPGGAAFALGWHGACLLARDTLADRLYSRALDGVTDTLTRESGETVTRHRHDNRLAMAMLTRLDKLCAHPAPDELHSQDTTDPIVAARAVAADFAHYLALVEAGCGAKDVAEFVEQSEHRRNPQLPQFNDTQIPPSQYLSNDDAYDDHDDELDEEEDAGAEDFDYGGIDGDETDETIETVEAVEEADAAVLAPPVDPVPPAAEAEAPAPEPAIVGASPDPAHPLIPTDIAQPSEEDPRCQARDGGEALYPLWWQLGEYEWRTVLPPPAGFREHQNGRFGEPGYWRAIHPDEHNVLAFHPFHEAVARILEWRAADGERG